MRRSTGPPSSWAIPTEKMISEQYRTRMNYDGRPGVVEMLQLGLKLLPVPVASSSQAVKEWLASPRGMVMKVEEKPPTPGPSVGAV